MESLIGKELGKYKIVEAIGEGGMASVYKAFDATMERSVAIKVLVTEPDVQSKRSKSMIDRFQLEARTIANLYHPHILQVHDYGVQDNLLYLVMPYFSHGTLKDLINQKGALPLGEVKHILTQIASALDYAHRQQIIHRDIKPSNILLDGEGHALLADFGLVKTLTSQTELTETGAILGTPTYIAPEYGSGAEFTERSDVYSLGITIFEAVVGRPPYGDTDTHSPMQIALQHITQPVPEISKVADNIPYELNEVFDKVLTKDPEERYATAMDFANAFSEAIQDFSDVRAVTDNIPRSQISSMATEAFPTAPSADDESDPGVVPSIQQAAPRDNKTSSTSITIQFNNRSGMYVGIAAVAIVVLVLAVMVLSQNNRNNTTSRPVQNVTDTSPGKASFLTTGGLGDTLSLQVTDMLDAPDGYSYQVWLVNSATGNTQNVGTLALDSMGTGTLTYNHPYGLFLPAVFNAVIVTLENSSAVLPSDEIAYYGQIPAVVSDALYEILLSSPDAIQERGLLASAIAEAYISGEQIQEDGYSNMTLLIANTERINNTLLGQESDYNGDGTGENPGFGVGLPMLLDKIDTQIETIVSAPDVSPQIQNNAEFIRTCVANTRTRLDKITSLQETVLAASSPDDVQDEITEMDKLIKELLAGFDQNENGRIEGYAGECGLSQIPGFTLLVGGMPMQEGDEAAAELISSVQPYVFTPGQDVCLDTELTFGIGKDEHNDMGDMGDM